jgi:hypothetical protein
LAREARESPLPKGDVIEDDRGILSDRVTNQIDDLLITRRGK